MTFGEKTLIMGILNMTPDSFSGDGFGSRVSDAFRCAHTMVEDGADIIDVGGESTRPGAVAVTDNEEIDRVVPVIRELVNCLPVPISVDTRKADVARAALDAGASIVNDIWGLRFDPRMADIVRSYQPVGLVAMHNHAGTRYENLMSDIVGALAASVQIAVDAGVPESQVMIDPGFGFGKTPAQNLEIVRELGQLRSIGRPILLGASRKSTIGLALGGASLEERLEGSLAVAVLAIANGADIVRVHDVKEMGRARALADPIVRGITGELTALRSPGRTL